MALSRTLPLFPAPDHKERISDAVPARKRTRLASARRPPGPEPQPRRNAAQLWLAVHLPRLAFDALGKGSGTISEKAPDPFSGVAPGERCLTPFQAQSVAVLDPEDRMQSVLACNEVARARGVRQGQPLNAALAFDATLHTLPRDAFRERQLLERIATLCQRFTPLVSLAGADELLLEVKGSLHLFGGARALLALVAAELQARGIEVSLALTPTPLSAQWLARMVPGRGIGVIRGVYGSLSRAQITPIPRPGTIPPGFPCVQRVEDLSTLLAKLPLGCLRWPEDVLERLVNMGVRGVGDLARLPRAGLARRIGPQWLEELERAFGRRAEVRRRFAPRERYGETRTLECEIETIEGLQAVLEPLLGHLQRFLRTRAAALGGLALELSHRAGAATRVRIGLAAPTGDVNHLRGLLRERLAALELRAPVVAVRLRSGPLRAAQAASAQLPYAPMSAFRATIAGGGSVIPDALPRLIERLQARLGRAAVFGLSLFADHRPELAWRAVQMPAREASVAPCNAPRPLWLLAEPQAPDISRWRIESGPERIESGWWDGGDVARDYFIARAPHGARGWVFRERRAPHRWFLQGWFG